MPRHLYPDPREDPKSRSFKGVPKNYPLVARAPGGLGHDLSAQVSKEKSFFNGNTEDYITPKVQLLPDKKHSGVSG